MSHERAPARVRQSVPEPGARRRPNLLFLMSDQQRADTITQNGPCLTPNLQALARQGADLRRCYAPNPICSPTRASLFTGLLPHAHGMTDVTHAVPPTQADLARDLPFWTRLLQEAGYRTGYFGKWHVERSDELERFGFEEYEVDLKLTGVTTHDGELEPRIEIEQDGYQTFLLAGVTDAPADSTSEARLVDRALQFLRDASEGGREAGAERRPWALFVSTEAPHDPYLVPRELYQRYDPDEIALPASSGDEMLDKPAVYRRIAAAWKQLSEEQLRQATACYYAACSSVDDQFGRLLDALEESGQADETLVVFTSDHGDYLGAHGLFLKGVAAFEEAYRVPLVLKGPGVEPDTVVEQPVSLLDLGRTLVRLLLGEEFGGHGRDLSGLLKGGSEPGGSEAEAFAEFHGQRLGYTQRIVWRGRYKYVFNGFDDDELYDLQEDPHELVNLAARPESREVLRELAAAMWRVVKRTGDDTLANAEYGMFRFAPVGPGEREKGRR